MKRKEFLSMVGMGAVAVACGYCVGGCKKDEEIIEAPTNVDFTLDLTNSSYSVLRNNGGVVYNGGVLVARLVTGVYVAVSQRCTHTGTVVLYDVNNNFFHCPTHGSNFRTDGSVINGPASRSLARYNTTLNGDLLRVFS
jgi:cytochrome b6-f complex iron-sulfur subunit